MQPAGQAEIDRAKADGRWDRAYDGAEERDGPRRPAGRARREPEGGGVLRDAHRLGALRDPLPPAGRQEARDPAAAPGEVRRHARARREAALMASRAVLVTGASRGIGAAVARGFAERGDRVAVHYGSRCRRGRAGRRGAARRRPRGRRRRPRRPRGGAPDGRRRGRGARRPRRARQQRRRSSSAHPITATTYEEWQAAWRRTMDVNLTGAANVTWCAVPHLRESPARGGSSTSPRAARSAASPTSPPTARARPG